MQLYKLLLAAFITAITVPPCTATTTFRFLNCTVELTDSVTAATIIGTSDAYTQSLSTFDVTIRLQDAAKTKEIQYLEHARRQVKNWNASEMEQLKQSLGKIEQFAKANKLLLGLPATVRIIKTTGKEEFGAAGYTRENNIILSAAPTEELVAHELFHVFSRANEQKRDELYAILGFKKCNRINYNGALQHRGITNPDCPIVAHYVPLQYQDTTRDMILVLYSTQPFTSGNVLLQSADVKLMELEGDDDHKAPKMIDGKPLMHGFAHVPDLFNKIGRNTAYALHPEEVCAEHFAMMITGEEIKQPEYIEKMKLALQH